MDDTLRFVHREGGAEGRRADGSGTDTRARARGLAYISLFGSLGTLVCCALPALLVLFGLGATVATVLSTAPWLTVLSRHKLLVFGVAGTMIAANLLYVYRLAPAAAARSGACAPGQADACAVSSRFSRVVLWLSVALYIAGFATAFVLPLALTP